MSWKKHFLSLLKSSKQILYILRSFCHRYTSKSQIYLRSILVNYIIKPKIKYGIELFYDVDKACVQIWGLLNRYMANIVLQKYTRDSDSAYLKLATLEERCNSSKQKRYTMPQKYAATKYQLRYSSKNYDRQ